VLLAPLLLLGSPAASSVAAPASVPTPAPGIELAAAPATEPGSASGPCVVIGASRAGRAWLPRARVQVVGGVVVEVRTLSPDARAWLSGGLVGVQRTSRRSDAARQDVLLELVVQDVSGDDGTRRSITCALAVTGQLPAEGLEDGGGAGEGHGRGARRLVRAD